MSSRICFYAKPYPRVKTYYDMIDTAVQHGLSAVEGFCQFEFQTPDIEAAKRIREYADEKGVIFPCFSVFSNPVCGDKRAEMQRLFGYAQVAAILGAPYFHHTVIGECCEPNNVVGKRDELFLQGIEAVREIYDYAQTLGVRTVYEDQGYILNGIDGFGRFLREVNRDVGVVADFGNICQVGESITDFIPAFANQIVHVHIKDVVLRDEDPEHKGYKTLDERFMLDAAVGSGEVDIVKGLEQLKANGYTGYFALEYGVSDDNSGNIQAAIDFISKNI